MHQGFFYVNFNVEKVVILCLQNPQQPYISKGHGKESGQYTFFDSNNHETNNNNEKETNNCVEKELKEQIKFLTKQERILIRLYTDFEFGQNLNYCIRHNCLDSSMKMCVEIIKNAILRQSIPRDITVYRGLSLSIEETRELIIAHATNRIIHDPNVIFSTSLSIDISKKYAKANKNKEKNVLLILKAHKGEKGLYIAPISKNKLEKEMLFSNPTYKITKWDVENDMLIFYCDILF